MNRRITGGRGAGHGNPILGQQRCQPEPDIQEDIPERVRSTRPKFKITRSLPEEEASLQQQPPHTSPEALYIANRQQIYEAGPPLGAILIPHVPYDIELEINPSGGESCLIHVWLSSNFPAPPEWQLSGSSGRGLVILLNRESRSKVLRHLLASATSEDQRDSFRKHGGALHGCTRAVRLLRWSASGKSMHGELVAAQPTQASTPKEER